jgi:apolipoprotein D and lipocalin family protein
VDNDVSVDFSAVTTPRDRVTVIATQPLTDNEYWTRFKESQLILFKDGEPLYQSCRKEPMRRLLLLILFVWMRQALAEALPATVPVLDLTRFSGTWYEVARKPVFFERLCVGDVMQHWQRAEDDSLKVTHHCRTASGAVDVARGRAVASNGNRNDKLRVSFFWPFFSPYWALWLDPEYRAILLGSPNRKYLWLLSRTPKLDPALEQQALAQARHQGYNLGNLIHTPSSAPQP